ncbi:hypothetical protein [Arthrobacter sp. zg-Y1110]|uniref:hypothetical protein n=1 Tax=Arthrobacter sp. zg-Y1110 TaxID=2886932 RepID=UPI001D15DD52|nr:hypothetical protein [Arthrobacter sp. zg-Y1110]MCC3292887.1 hypothetical protein [Arthrobacter sp. zg-Y1110]UWX86825.1 hypothetical protein N2K99_18455 [Arthrobacter sp. zg-Y1110]
MSTIPLAAHKDETFESAHDYGSIYVQGGNGVVIGWRNSAPARRTAFVECFPEGAFIRGEGATVAEADEACWSKLRAYLDCPGHQWVAGKAHSPVGTCAICRTRRSDAFTAEETGSFCTACSEPTFRPAVGDPERRLLCESCDPKSAYGEAVVLAMFSFHPDASEYHRRLDDVCEGVRSEDPEALDWAYEHLEMEKPRP